jgi:CHC2 zinc finger
MIPQGSADRTGQAGRPAGLSTIDAANELVAPAALAQLLCGPTALRRVGQAWVAICPIPGHTERNASFTIYDGDRGWYCYGCGRGGDTVRLGQLAWGIENAREAAAEVLSRFGFELPEDPPPTAPRSLVRRARRNKRQAPVRRELDLIRRGRVQRRLFRWYCAPMLAAIEDGAERAEETRVLWEQCSLAALLLVREIDRERAVAKPGRAGEKPRRAG